ncbi:helix-turn-helix domain-containing protein [Schleiferilactobacillus harbinensis]|uniref:helix-turn-helix domain-containing protein n=1 Tax=Schleiferilactobacillus harbinensis TaxID=304207 RepID=UPI0035D09090
MDVTIGEAFHRWRISHNMTLNTVAEGITTPSTVSRFERGETQIGTPVFLALLARLRDNFEMLQTYFAGQDRNAFFQRSPGRPRCCPRIRNRGWLLCCGCTKMKARHMASVI